MPNKKSPLRVKKAIREMVDASGIVNAAGEAFSINTWVQAGVLLLLRQEPKEQIRLLYDVASDANSGVAYATELANRTQRCFSLNPDTCVPCQSAIVNGVYGR